MSGEESDGNGAGTDESEDADGGEELTVDALRERLQAIEERLEAAETEADLDDVEEDVRALEDDLEAADLPEADDEDEDDPQEELESDLESLEEDLEEARGPYAEDVVAIVGDVKETIAETRWTEPGEADLIDAVDTFVDDVNDAIGTSVSLVNDGDDIPARLTATLENAAAAIEEADLDPDDDAETVAALLAAAEDLEAAVDDAQTWDDLSVREQLDAQGYYEPLDHVKDYPPELHALKVHRKRGNAEMVLLALEEFDSDFMENHCLEALRIMAPEEAIEPMLQRAGKRDQDAIAILGKIASEEPVDTLLDYVDNDSNPQLQKATFRALGEIGSSEAVQPLADQLVAENDEVRSHAARALGLIGDTRAIEPLADVLADDEDDTVRASAAWALNRIGTESALEAAADYADDSSYVVQSEAERARDATTEPAV